MMMKTVKEATETVVSLLEGQIDTFDEFGKDELLLLTSAALKSESFTPKEYLEIFDAIILAKHDNNQSILHNLALIAVAAGLDKEAYGFAKEAYENGEFYSATAIARKALKAENTAFRKEFEQLIEKIAEMGHFHTKFYLFDQKFMGWGIFGYPFRIAYRLYLLPLALLTVIKNMHDPKLNALPGKIPDRQSKVSTREETDGPF